jgi:hypothetical protein
VAIKSFKRYEKKYLLSHEQYSKIIPGLLEHMDPDEHCMHGEKYNIYNIYYDTENSDVIRHSISKPYYKEKLRLRSYNVVQSMDDKVFLELKKKINGIVNKRRAVMTYGDAQRFLSEGVKPCMKDFRSGQVLNEIEYYLSRNKVRPAVYIGYQRMAFFGKENRDFRVTFDSRILTRREELSLEQGFYGKELMGEGMSLMEVKILGAMPLWFAEMLSGLSIYSTNFSKYGQEYMDRTAAARNNNTGRMKKIC